jgi:plasmid stabilization system protein ParE
MKLPLWTDEARAEAEDAADWYFERDRRVGERFEAALRSAVAMVCEAPARWPFARDRIHRRLVVEGFPYSLIYRILSGDQVLLVALRHHSRRPDHRLLP